MPDLLLPVDATTCTVNGYRYRQTEPAWTGLALSRAELRDQASIMVWIAGADAPYDLHLSVPWQHPDDGPWTPQTGCWYRVRPKREKGAAFVRVDGVWWLRYGGTARRKAREAADA